MVKEIKKRSFFALVMIAIMGFSFSSFTLRENVSVATTVNQDSQKTRPGTYTFKAANGKTIKVILKKAPNLFSDGRAILVVNGEPVGEGYWIQTAYSVVRFENNFVPLPGDKPNSFDTSFVVTWDGYVLRDIPYSGKYKNSIKCSYSNQY